MVSEKYVNVDGVSTRYLVEGNREKAAEFNQEIVAFLKGSHTAGRGSQTQAQR
jgi:hypothetical protein